MIKNMSLVLLCLFAGISFYQPIEVSDVGWHLATGQWILAHAQVPYSDPFAITSDPAPWIFTQWLGSTLLAIPYLWGGPEALKIFRVGVFLVPILMFIFYARRKVPFSLVFLITVFMIYGLTTRCLTRSFIFNFIFISLLLIILFSFQKDRLVRRLYVLPIIALIWGNIHLGSFVYGFFILFSFLFSIIINLLNEMRTTTSIVIKQNLSKLVKQVVMVCGLYFICVGITPYGIEGFLYPYRVFLFPDYIYFYKFTFSVAENLPPAYILTLPGIWFWGLLGTTLIAIIFGQKKDLFSMLLFVLAVFLFILFSRGSDFFVLVCAYISVDQISSGITNEKLTMWRWILKQFHWVCLILALIVSVQLSGKVTKQAYLNGREWRVLRLDYIANHPKDSIEFLKDLGLGGNIFCNEHIGSYIVGAQYPRVTPK